MCHSLYNLVIGCVCLTVSKLFCIFNFVLQGSSKLIIPLPVLKTKSHYTSINCRHSPEFPPKYSSEHVWLPQLRVPIVHVGKDNCGITIHNIVSLLVQVKLMNSHSSSQEHSPQAPVAHYFPHMLLGEANSPTNQTLVQSPTSAFRKVKTAEFSFPSSQSS